MQMSDDFEKTGQINACAEKMIKKWHCITFITIKILGHYHNFLHLKNLSPAFSGSRILKFLFNQIIEYLC